MRTHALLSAVGIVMLILIRPPVAWSLAFVVLVVVGVTAELLNSALEAALDRLHPDLDPTIGAAKEMASGAAAIVNLAAVAVFLGAIVVSAI